MCVSVHISSSLGTPLSLRCKQPYVCPPTIFSEWPLLCWSNFQGLVTHDHYTRETGCAWISPSVSLQFSYFLDYLVRGYIPELYANILRWSAVSLPWLIRHPQYDTAWAQLISESWKNTKRLYHTWSVLLVTVMSYIFPISAPIRQRMNGILDFPHK